MQAKQHTPGVKAWGTDWDPRMFLARSIKFHNCNSCTLTNLKTRQYNSHKMPQITRTIQHQTAISPLPNLQNSTEHIKLY